MPGDYTVVFAVALVLAFLDAYGIGANDVVSTTHAIVGAVIGTSIAAFGGEAVNWNWENKGVAQIIASWFISPALAAALAAVLFLLTKYLVLRRKNSFRWGLVEVPVFFAFALFINTYLVTTKGMPKMDLVGSGQFTEAELVGISWAVGIGASAILSTIIIFWAKHTLDKKYVKNEEGRHVLSPEYIARVEEAAAKARAAKLSKLKASPPPVAVAVGSSSPSPPSSAPGSASSTSSNSEQFQLQHAASNAYAIPRTPSSVSASTGIGSHGEPAPAQYLVQGTPTPVHSVYRYRVQDGAVVVDAPDPEIASEPEPAAVLGGAAVVGADEESRPADRESKRSIFKGYLVT
eukprot:tig00000826_g4566.t1